MTSEPSSVEDAAAQRLPALFRRDQRIAGLVDQGLSFDLMTPNASGKPSSRVLLESISVDPAARGQGIAASAMKILLEMADAQGVTLELEVGRDEQEIDLVAWYARLGFHWKEGFMERLPSARTGYHVTTAAAFASIAQQGLLPQIGLRSEQAGECEEALYFFASKEDVEHALMNWMGECFEDDEEILVLEVDLQGIASSRGQGQFEIIVTEEIPRERITTVYDENLTVTERACDVNAPAPQRRMAP